MDLRTPVAMRTSAVQLAFTSYTPSFGLSYPTEAATISTELTKDIIPEVCPFN